MSKYITHQVPSRNKTNDLPDFPWRPVILHGPSRAGQYVMRRYHVSPHIAELIAALAGLGGEDR
jgi:hypothetical protein